MLRLIFLLFLLAAPASAELAISLVGDEPTRRIVLENRSECATGPFEFSLDLKGASGRLVFDTAEGGGALTFEEGAERVVAATNLRAGDTVLTISLRDLPAGARLVAAVALDDRRRPPRPVDTPQQLEGAVVAVIFGAERMDAPFGPDPRLSLPAALCLS